MAIKILIIILTSLILVECDWTLTWNDEFDKDTLNMNKKMWDIEDTGNRCEEPFESQLNCMISREQNVRTIAGVLAITAIQEDNTTNTYEKPFTSGYIYSSKYFEYGKFEVRAAMPMGKLLRAQINLYEPQEQDNTWVGIAVADFKQVSGLFDVGVWEELGNFSHYYSFEPGTNLSDFHVYTVVREEGVLRWYFDGYNYYNYSFSHLDSRLKERLSGEMEIDINLVVGGPKIKGTFTDQDVQNWKCSSLIVDYVRVYKYTNQPTKLKEALKNTENSPDDISNKIQKLNKLNNTGKITKSTRDSSTSIMYVYYVVPIIAVLVIIIAVLVWKLKQHRKQLKRIDEQGGINFDSVKGENIYNTIDDQNYGKFGDETYEIVEDNYQDIYLDVYDDSSKDPKSNEEPCYLEMIKGPNLPSKNLLSSNEYI